MKEAVTAPCHVAVIMDGNGRWAKKRLLPRSAGHRAGLKRMIALTQHAFLRGVQCLTLFALSVENLSRPAEELETLFELFREYFRINLSHLIEEKVLLRVIGDRTLIPADICETIRNAEEATKGGDRTLVLAIGYGARQEILAAVNAAVKAGKQLTEEEFSALLQTDGLPDPDLIIRTGKELRLSNFLLYQSAYAELYFSNKMFPDFTEEDLDAAFRSYASRERRYGRI